jgi:hypothetical protein
MRSNSHEVVIQLPPSTEYKTLNATVWGIQTWAKRTLLVDQPVN